MTGLPQAHPGTRRPEPGREPAPSPGGVLLVVDGAVDVPDLLRRSPRCRQVTGDIWAGPSRFTGERAELWAMLRQDRYPHTTPPTVSDLAAAYGRGLATVGVHISSQLSATVARGREAAARVATEQGTALEVVDTGSLSVGAGLVALAVHQAADGPLGAVAALARSVSERLHTFALVQEVRALRRSNRASLVPRAHLVSNHPLVMAVRGRAVPLAQPRHRRHALADLGHHVEQTTGRRLGAWAIGHGNAPDVDAVVEHLTQRLGMPPAFVAELDPAVGAHLGPDSLVVGAVVGPLE